MNPEGEVLDNLNLLKATYDIQLTLLGGELRAAKNEYTDNLGTFQIDKSNLTDKINEDVINAIADFYNIETRTFILLDVTGENKKHLGKAVTDQ